MAQTFDIRFARSAGLAGLFEEPANEFRWKGTGRLSIDAAGISIAVKRGLLGLFSRAQSRRISPENLLHVYREGSALRLEFSTRESRRSVLPIWVSDREAAARIVTLLPTRKSVEYDDEPGIKRNYRVDRRLVALLATAAAILAAVWMLPRDQAEELAASPVEAADPSAPILASSSQSTESPALNEVGPPSPASRSTTPRVVPGSQDYRYQDPARASAPGMETATRSETERANESSRAVASAEVERVANAVVSPPKSSRDIWLEQFLLFQAESNQLRSDYLYARDSFAYESLEAIESRWLAVTSRIVNTSEFAGPQFYALREMELSVSQNWRDHLSTLAAARRLGGDRRLLAEAAYHLEFAERVEAQFQDLGR